MKKETIESHNRIANDALFYIYTHIDTDICVESLAGELGVGRFTLHRIFKEVFGQSIYQTIKSIRLEKAANLLINTHATISEIALQCGYSSQASFLHAFKARFGMTPKMWRRGGFRDYSHRLLGSAAVDGRLERKFERLGYTIVKRPPVRAYYIRHKGYDASIAEAWQKLRLFALSHDLEEAQEIALYHDNPAIRLSGECAYVACLATERRLAGSKLPSFTIAGGIYARFDLKGEPGEEMALMHWIYHDWLPRHGFETTPKPSYAIYRSNHFLNEPLDLSYFVSITY
ncbi:AraC family transcriptional regulator [Hydrogenimonas sp.]